MSDNKPVNVPIRLWTRAQTLHFKEKYKGILWRLEEILSHQIRERCKRLTCWNLLTKATTISQKTFDYPF